MAIVYIDVTPPTYAQKNRRGLAAYHSFEIISVHSTTSHCQITVHAHALAWYRKADTRYRSTRDHTLSRGGRRCARRMGANSVFGFRPRAIRRASGLERDQIPIESLKSHHGTTIAAMTPTSPSHHRH